MPDVRFDSPNFNLLGALSNVSNDILGRKASGAGAKSGVKNAGKNAARPSFFRTLSEEARVSETGDGETPGIFSLEGLEGLSAGEAVSTLLDDVHNAGDALKKRPFPDEIASYKRSVKRFISFVVKNSFDLSESEGLANKYKPAFKNRKGAAKDDRVRYTNIAVINEKLESLAAALMSSQADNIRFLSRIDEINGLLVNLLR